MKKLLFIFILCISVNAIAQTPPTIKYFSTQQQAELKPYVTWWAKSEAKAAADSASKTLWEAIRLLQAQARRDSTSIANMDAKLSNLIKNLPTQISDSVNKVRKSLADSMGTLLSANAVIGRIDSTVKALNEYKITNDKAVKGLQDAIKLLEGTVNTLKNWYDKMKLVNFNF